MREYIEISITCSDSEQADIVIAFLADYPFDSFDTEGGDSIVKAYILAEEWAQCREEALAAIEGYGEVSHEKSIEDENWNQRWEQESFHAVEIDDIMVIRAPHHAAPQEGVIDIIVQPQMSFGSGHHHTTRMMCRMIHQLRAAGHVLDVGCGTGILAIAALKCGAAQADAVDIDPWSVESATAAASLNGLHDRMKILLGTIEVVKGHTYDMVMANINRNIILADIAHYAAALNDNGTLLLSGFLAEDVDAIVNVAKCNELHLVKELQDEEWRALLLVKSPIL